MEIEEDGVSLINKIPRVENCCFCVSVKSGTKLIAILGILIGLLCVISVMIQSRKYLTLVETLLFIFLMLFVMITVLFLIVSVVLLRAAVDENPVLMSYYIWMSIVYWSVQLVLAIAIPLLFAIANIFNEGKYRFDAAIIWMAIIVVIALGWTHFISVVSSYRRSLL